MPKGLYNPLLFSSFWPQLHPRKGSNLLHLKAKGQFWASVSGAEWAQMMREGGRAFCLWLVGIFGISDFKLECLKGHFQSQISSKVVVRAEKDERFQIVTLKFKPHICKNFLSFDKNGHVLLGNFYPWTKSSYQFYQLTCSLPMLLQLSSELWQ